MRIVLTGISHETNTYCQGLTRAASFHCLRGKAMLATAGQETDVGGAAAACARWAAQGPGAQVESDGDSDAIEAVPLLFAQAQPSATIERQTFEDFCQEIVDGLLDAQSEGGVDAVVLLLHGAGVVEGIEDLEGELASRVRAVVGDQVPIAASFDLHGNISERMCSALNGVFACHQYPHIDLHIQAEAAVDHVVAMVREKRLARCCVVNAPLLLPTTTTFEGIGEATLHSVLAIEKASAVVDISWFHGFPYTDIADVGSTAVVTYFEDVLSQERAQALAHEVAGHVWQSREKFRPLSLSADEAVVRASKAAAERTDPHAPVVIHETSDNCGAGTPGDGTHLLRSMLESESDQKMCFGFIVDAVTAAQAHKAGTGATIQVELGARSDDLHGTPILASATVKALHDGRLTLQHMFRGMPLNLGPLARLVIDGVDVVVGSRRSQTFDREPFLAVGIDVLRYDIVALKSSSHFRACYQDIASTIVTADPPGLSTHNISVFPRQASARALWPINPQARFD